jgi:hypothetical protein
MGFAAKAAQQNSSDTASESAVIYIADAVLLIMLRTPIFFISFRSRIMNLIPCPTFEA